MPELKVFSNHSTDALQFINEQMNERNRKEKMVFVLMIKLFLFVR